MDPGRHQPCCRGESGLRHSANCTPNVCGAVVKGSTCPSLFHQDVLNSSDHQAVLFLGNLVEGKYSFTLTVTDSKGQSSSSRGAVEVKAGTHPRAAAPRHRAHRQRVSPSDVYERDLVELVLEVAVSQISQRQRDMLLRQVGVLLGVLDTDIVVREIAAFNEHR